MEFVCPTCGKKLSRDLVIILEHTEKHVINEIKKKHPKWIERDGTCEPCAEYYRKQMKG